MNEKHEATLNRMLKGLDAPENVRELARALSHRAFDAGLHDERPTDAIIVCAVDLAFRRAGTANPPEDIAGTTTFDSDAIARTHRLLADELDLDPAPTSPHDYVSRLVESVGLDERTEEILDERTEAMAHDIVETSLEAGLQSGVSPAGIAAGAVYIAFSKNHYRVTQDEVADAADVSQVTLRHRCAEQTKLLGLSGYSSIAPERRRLFETE